MKLFGIEFKFNGYDIWHRGNFDPASKVDKAEFDNLEIGGRNLILNSDFSQGLTNWTKTSNAISLEVGGGYRGDGLRLVITTTGTVTPRQRINLELMANDTLSAQVKVKTIQGNFSNMVMRVANQLTIPLVSVKQLDNDWELYTYRVTVSSPITLSNVFGFYKTTGEFIIDEIKLERGNKATDWTPAPEDIQAEIEKKADMSVVPTKTSQLTNDSGFITSSASITGNAATATKLQTARTITLSGDVSGSASFDGSSNISISATVADDSHNHVISNIDNLQTTLDSKAPLASPAFTGTPTAPTASNGTNTNQIATTAFVQNALSSGGYGDMLKATYDKNNDGIVDNAEKVNGFTVEANVPANAKFTDTTYSEITTAEIDAGTASTRRTITGRRVKYILDKVQGWISSLTKADVGLSNVDNIQQATKAEFNAHDSDTTKHIASGERTTWNTVTNKVDKVTGKQLSTEDYTTEEKNKLSGIEDNANNYIHPTTSGNKHIPSGGASGQFLKWDSDGTATWDSIPGGLELGETSGTAYRGDRGKIAYDHSQSAHAPSDAQKNSDITKSEIEAKLTGTITSHNHTGLMPAHHAETHHVGGSDELTPSDIGAEPALGYTPVNKAGDTMTGTLIVDGKNLPSGADIVTMKRGSGTNRFVLETQDKAMQAFMEAGATIGLVGTITDSDFRIRTNYTDRVSIRGSDGNVGIGTTSTTQKLDVNGKIRMRTQTTTADGDDIVATKKYVDDNAGGEIYHVGTSPPSDTNLFWIDTSE